MIASTPPFPLRLSQEKLADPWMKQQIHAIGVLLTDDGSLTAFQTQLLHGLIAYSNSAIARSPGEKLVLAFAALETLFLANDGEPIQQNLARRLALFIEDDFATRKTLVTLIKDAYKLRSKFMHHGERPSAHQHRTINDVLEVAYKATMRALQLHEQLASIGNLGKWLDDQMLGLSDDTWDRSREIPIPSKPELRRKYIMSVREDLIRL
jgi:Apea-like HEPN